ncbi:alpha/beta fold hydrolase [Facklamia sp. DSM 111018]|uniref:Alpha/beta fold hydrolase n=1 Tax=Facklamia lactis TaxID=2749967 RepID=A0ABS0LSA0_9LACT|nr:alpha/beta hydrolase [Facklamia lactis]MBG9986134.1 alpha/beta fold hydrolase [Facklamia lactis]
MARPEIGKSVKTGQFTTNYLEVGENIGGIPLLFVHGSGPGVSAYANWRLILPLVEEINHAYAMDMVGFGFSDKPTGDEVNYGRELWTQQIIDFMDALNLEQVNLVGNSFGGSLGLSVALNYPDRINKLIMMGPMGVESQIPFGLNEVWGYKGTEEHMAQLIDLFTYNKKFASEDLIKTRYEASLEPGFHEAFSTMFPEPRQQSVDDLSFPDEEIRKIPHKTLIVHGREDQVVPVTNSYRLINLIEDAELHIFGGCGHWTQIEKSQEFAHLVNNFVAENQA